MYDEIKSFELFSEIEEIDDAIRRTVYENDDQRMLDFLLHGLRVMERMVEIKMVNKDLAFYQKNQEALKTDKYLTFIKGQAGRLGIPVNLPADISYLDVYMPAWADFYRVAGLRDEAMLASSLRVGRDNKQKLIAIVTGGFHTRALTELMRDKGISHIVITPRITENIPGPYFDRLQGKRSVMDQLFDELNAGIPGQNAQ